MKINIFKIEKKPKKFKKQNFKVNSNLYWHLILLFVFVIILGSFAFGYYLFNNTSKEFSKYGEVTGSQKGTDEKAKVEKELNIFTDRQNQSLKILSSPAPVLDPSL